jgi:hypothetical protein
MSIPDFGTLHPGYVLFDAQLPPSASISLLTLKSLLADGYERWR